VFFPNSSAMDATASVGGPITVLPQILTGSPDQIAKHVTELLKKATEFTTLFADFEKAAQQLEQTWSGAASESALKKIGDSLSSLTKIIGVVQQGAELLGVSGTLVKTAQEAYRTVVSAVNPTVAGLMSNPWTYGAAVALSTATSASLKAFIEAIGALLKTLGGVDLANQITRIATIIGEIEKLFGGGATTPTTPTTPATGGTGATGSVPTNTTVAGSPVAAPQAPAPVASPSGQQAVSQPVGDQAPSFTGYTPPALAGYGNDGSSAATGGSVPTGADSWVPVDQPPPATTPPSAVPGTSDHVIIQTDLTTGHSTVDAPAGKDLDVDVDITYNGQHYEQHVDIDAAAGR
jgi:hypothetical protein